MRELGDIISYYIGISDDLEHTDDIWLRETDNLNKFFDIVFKCESCDCWCYKEDLAVINTYEKVCIDCSVSSDFID